VIFFVKAPLLVSKLNVIWPKKKTEHKTLSNAGVVWTVVHGVARLFSDLMIDKEMPSRVWDGQRAAA
jgi:hypothetical protein